MSKRQRVVVFVGALLFIAIAIICVAVPLVRNAREKNAQTEDLIVEEEAAVGETDKTGETEDKTGEAETGAEAETWEMSSEDSGPATSFTFMDGEQDDPGIVWEGGFTVSTLNVAMEIFVADGDICQLATGGGILNGKSYSTAENTGLILVLDTGEYTWTADVSGNLTCLQAVTDVQKDNFTRSAAANMFDPLSLNCGDGCKAVVVEYATSGNRVQYDQAPELREEPVNFLGSSFDVSGTDYLYIVSEGDPATQGVRIDCVSTTCKVNDETWSKGDWEIFPAPMSDNDPSTDLSVSLSLTGDVIITEYIDGIPH